MAESNRGQHLSHLDEAGKVRMVDVGPKPVTARTASAEGEIRMEAGTLEAIVGGDTPKGDVVAVARIAAIGGAKRTSELIPLCHPLLLDSVDVDVWADEDLPGLRARVSVASAGRTGVEMEALCGVATCLLAVYDMCKGLERGMTIGPIRLQTKTGGATGTCVTRGDRGSPSGSAGVPPAATAASGGAG